MANTTSREPPVISNTQSSPTISSTLRPSSSRALTSSSTKKATSSTDQITSSSRRPPSTETTPTPTPTSRASTPTLSSSSDKTNTTPTSSEDSLTASRPSPSSTGNTVQSTSSNVVPTSTYTTTVLGAPTTQSTSGTGDLSFTSLYTSTDSNGVSHTVTQIISRPSNPSRSGGFIHNPVAVTGLSILIGVICAAMVAFAIFRIRKRRKARNDDLAAFSEMSYVAGGVPSYYGGGNQQNNGYRMTPMNSGHAPRSGSANSLDQPPLAPNDSPRGVPGPHGMPPRAQLFGNNPTMPIGLGEQRGYDPYAKNVVGRVPVPNYAGYDAGTSADSGAVAVAGAGTRTNPEKHMYDGDPFASHSQDGHSQVSGAGYHDAPAAPRPSVGLGAGDEKYYGDHGPMNNAQLDHYSGEELVEPRRHEAAHRSDATLQDHYDFYRKHL